MKKVKLLICLLLIGGMATLNSCKKEAGPTGPQGPAGTNGTNGTNGNANVNSTTINATFTWDGTNYWDASTVTGVSILTSSIVSSGAVMLYLNNGGNYTALPFTQSDGGSVVTDLWFQYSVGQIAIVVENSDESNPNVTSLTFKLVCIDASSRLAHPNVNWKNYNEVKKALDLKD